MKRSRNTMGRLGMAAVLLAVAAIVLAAWVEPAWAQSFQRSTADRGSGGHARMLLQWGGLAAALLVAYGAAFYGFFPTILRRGVWPLRSYGLSWSLFVVLALVAVLAIFWADLVPPTATMRSGFWTVYKYHVMVMAIGLVVAMVPLFLFRSHHEAPA